MPRRFGGLVEEYHLLFDFDFFKVSFPTWSGLPAESANWRRRRESSPFYHFPTGSRIESRMTRCFFPLLIDSHRLYAVVLWNRRFPPNRWATSSNIFEGFTHG